MFFIFEGMSLFLLTSLSISRKEEVFVNKSLSSNRPSFFQFCNFPELYWEFGRPVGVVRDDRGTILSKIQKKNKRFKQKFAETCFVRN